MKLVSRSMSSILSKPITMLRPAGNRLRQMPLMHGCWLTHLT